jgi:transcriptional regulator with XRE-family HTH domain
LGPYLKGLRNSKGLSLRDVANETGISNGFLSQIESGKVKEPSPIALYKLAALYGVPYEVLMARAGYPVAEDQELSNRAAGAAFKRLGEITEDEEQSLLDYLTFLRRGRREARRR